MLGAYIFIIVSSSWIDPLIIMQCLSLSLITFFVLLIYFLLNLFFSFFKKNIYIYLFLAVLGLHCCMWAFSTCSDWGLLFIAVYGLLIVVAFLVAEHTLQVRKLQQLWHTGSVVVACRLQSAGSVVVAHGLSCSTACGIFLDQGLNSCPLHWQADS